MANLKYIFSNISPANKKERVFTGDVGSVPKVNKDIKHLEGETKKKELPLFYEHKIRVPKYEFF